MDKDRQPPSLKYSARLQAEAEKNVIRNAAGQARSAPLLRPCQRGSPLTFPTLEAQHATQRSS